MFERYMELFVEEGRSTNDGFVVNVSFKPITRSII